MPIAERADEDRVEAAERLVAVGRDRFAGLQVVIRAPRQFVQIEAANRVQYLDRFRCHLTADSVSGN